jgi:8-oxo-dGTP pyrophosphatase MutT (NUDIX family)
METELIKRYAGVVVKCEDKVLLCKRASTSELPGFWSLPAGKVGKIENAMLGAKREFFEETNISIDDKDIELVGFINRITAIPARYINPANRNTFICL